MSLIFLVFAFVCFVISAWMHGAWENKLIPAGLAFWVLSQIIGNRLNI